MKQKLLGRTFYRDKNTSEFKHQLTDTIEIKNNFRNYTHQIENTFKNEKFKGKKFYLL
jgi:hypothetical protein